MSPSRVVRRVLLAGCLAGALFALSAAPAGAVTDPAEWGDTFCTETVGWLQGALDGAQGVQDQTSQPGITPKDGKQILVGFLDTGVDATASYLKTMKGTGAPDITNGAKIQAAILAGIAGSGARLVALDKAAKALPTRSEAAFAKGASKLGAKLATFTSPFQKAMNKAGQLDSSKSLATILTTLPSCQPFLNGSVG